MPKPEFFFAAGPLSTCLLAITEKKRLEFLNHNVTPGELIATFLKGEYTESQRANHRIISDLAHILSIFGSDEQVVILQQEAASLADLLNDKAKQIMAFCHFPTSNWQQLTGICGNVVKRDLLAAILTYRTEIKSEKKGQAAAPAVAGQPAIGTLLELKEAIELFKLAKFPEVTSLHLLKQVAVLKTIINSPDSFFEIIACCKDVSTRELLFLLGPEWALEHLNATDALIRVIKSVPRAESWQLRNDWQEVQAFLKPNYAATITNLTPFVKVYEACAVPVYASRIDFERDKCIPYALIDAGLKFFTNQDGFRVLCRTLNNACELEYVLQAKEFNIGKQITNLAMLITYLDAISNSRNDKKRELYPVQEVLLQLFANQLGQWVTNVKQLKDLEAKLVTDTGISFLYTTLNPHLPSLYPKPLELEAVREKHKLPQDEKPGFLSGFFGSKPNVASVATPRLEPR